MDQTVVSTSPAVVGVAPLTESATALSAPLGRGLYALVVLVPLLASSEPLVRRFGLLIFLSVVLSAVVYGYAFVSVWCFFAALLSAWLGVRLPERLAGQSAIDGAAGARRPVSQS